jgi:hypothetical protein
MTPGSRTVHLAPLAAGGEHDISPLPRGEGEGVRGSWADGAGAPDPGCWLGLHPPMEPMIMCSNTVLTAAANVTINSVTAMIRSTLCSPMPFMRRKPSPRCDANISASSVPISERESPFQRLRLGTGAVGRTDRP